MVKQFKEVKRSEFPDHLLRLPGKRWAFWRCAGLRGAGFPAKSVLKLSAPQYALAADEALEAEREWERAKQSAIAEVNKSLDELRQNGQWGDKRRRGMLLDAVRALRAGKIPRPEGSPQVPGSINILQAAFEKHREKKESFRAATATAERELSEAICEVARDEKFREAIIWQNRQALHTAIDVLLDKARNAGPRDSKLRQYEELVANYLQRYSVKNDTISFFGPVGWARLASEGKALDLKPGSELLNTRKVYFESWCIDTLANVLAEDKHLLPWIVPIRTPFIRLEGTAIHHPVLGMVRLPAELASVLESCDGSKTAKEIAQQFANLPQVSLQGESYLMRLLDKLQARGLIFWEFNIPVGPNSEELLRKHLLRITDEGLRDECLTILGELEQARDAVARAAGDVGRLDEAMGRLEETFVRITGKASTRSAGQMYAGRTLVYEDCRRDGEVTLGPEILQALEPPLSLLLMSARWFTFELAKVYKRKFKEIYIDLVRKTGSLSIDGAKFYLEVQPYISEGDATINNQVLRRFQERWLKILSIHFSERSAHYTAEELRPLVESEFDAPRPGWPSACHHSPDIMVAAKDSESIERGDFQLILGEMHLGGNTLAASLFVYQHPSPEELIGAMQADVRTARVLPMRPKDTPRLTSRTVYSLVSPNDFRLEYCRNVFAPDRSLALPISSLVIQVSNGELIAQTRDGRLKVDLLELFSGFFNRLSMSSFKIVETQGHTPRITIDRLVICRESWRFPSSELDFAFEKDASARFLSARRWAQAHGLPRFVFAKLPVEVKPFYVDFDSPIYIDMLSKVIRNARNADAGDDMVTLTEMHPTPDMAWLSDAEGNRYTSEFRIVAVDQA